MNISVVACGFMTESSVYVIGYWVTQQVIQIGDAYSCGHSPQHFAASKAYSFELLFYPEAHTHHLRGAWIPSIGRSCE